MSGFGRLPIVAITMPDVALMDRKRLLGGELSPMLGRGLVDVKILPA
jgi:hypothetical protein